MICNLDVFLFKIRERKRCLQLFTLSFKKRNLTKSIFAYNYDLTQNILANEDVAILKDQLFVNLINQYFVLHSLSCPEI